MATERNASLKRVLMLMRRLEGRHYAPALEALAGDYGVSTRTIRRDLALLESVGVKVPQFRYNPELGRQPHR